MNKYENFNVVDAGLIPKDKSPPLDFFEYLREHDPVHWNPAPEDYETPLPGASMENGFWILSRYDDVQMASRKTDVFSSHEGGPVIWDVEPEQLERQRAGIMGMDDPAHAQLKRLVIPPFLPKNLSEYEPRIKEKVTEIVDSVASKGECELVFDVASRLPVTTFCELMGIPDEDHNYIFSLGNRLADTESPESNNEEAQAELFVYAEKLAQEKRANPDNSMLSLYANGEVDGQKLPPLAVNMFFVTLSIAGHETTRNTLVHFFRLMNEYPEQYELLKSDPDKHLVNAINEVLRFCPPVMQFRRTCLEDIEVGGKLIKKGDKVYLSYVSANRDAEMFENPNDFDITRKNASRHLSFGIGPHICLGARLAITQLSILITELMERIPDITLVGEPTYLESIWFHAIMKMPVKFTAETKVKR